jgi:peptidoglycan/xylan/chitin deacetylase (PgdA/CDA1 family)
MPQIVYCGAAQRDEVALTFDDGPSQWTADIARSFEDHDCRATFFQCGRAVEERPAAAAALAGSGHELGNHLWTHTDPATQTRTQLRDEVERTRDAIGRAAGIEPTLLRPPYLKAPREVAAAARGTGARAIVLRSISISDWAAESAEEIVEPILGDIHAGDILCLHDGISSEQRAAGSRKPTVNAIRRLVPALLERGLHPVTVSQQLR